MLNGGAEAEKLKVPKSWPVTVVALIFLLQGLAAGFYALRYVGLIVDPVMSGPAIGLAALDAISSVALIVAGVGLIARVRACLAISVVLAAMYLAGTGASLIEVWIQGAGPLAIAANLAYIALGYVQYLILRSRSTTALFAAS